MRLPQLTPFSLALDHAGPRAVAASPPLWAALHEEAALQRRLLLLEPRDDGSTAPQTQTQPPPKQLKPQPQPQPQPHSQPQSQIQTRTTTQAKTRAKAAAVPTAPVCMVGGGAPEPRTTALLRSPPPPASPFAPLVCRRVVESWGSYEQFQIGLGEGGVYTLQVLLPPPSPCRCFYRSVSM